MQISPTHPAHQDDLTIPGHLAPYAAEVEAWRLEALAYRAARAIETGIFR